MRILRTLPILGLAIFLAAPALAGDYLAGGTFVVRTPQSTILDNGGVLCQGAEGDGVGGGCLAFPTDGSRAGFVRVEDDAAGLEVAFQVCLDHNGDGVCGGPQLDPDCADEIYFSHDDAGRFFNPLGPLPTALRGGCVGGFAGYVVLLCQGVHGDGASAHTHALTRGSITRASDGTGYGDFCGAGEGEVPVGTNATVAKAYVIV